VRRGCHLLVGVDLVEGLSDAERTAWRAELLIEHTAKETPTSAKAQAALAAAEKHNAFHWFPEFPEVFEHGGFNAFVGNPPFLGGTRISSILGTPYLVFLQRAYPGFESRADMCSLFFRRAFDLLRTKGHSGMIATNTIWVCLKRVDERSLRGVCAEAISTCHVGIASSAASSQ
jgi:hypothetical protein